MALTLDEDERRALLESSTTGILTTLRRDGRPVSLPVWFVLLDGELYVRTPRVTAKMRRIRREPSGAFLVERGERWTELTALHHDVAISEVDDDTEADLVGRVHAALDAKYAGLAAPADRLPDRMRALYADRAVLRLRPVGKELSWANAKVRLRP